MTMAPTMSVTDIINCVTTNVLRKDWSLTFSMFMPLKIFRGLKDDSNNAGYMPLRRTEISNVPPSTFQGVQELRDNVKCFSVSWLKNGRSEYTRTSVIRSAIKQ